MGIFNNIFVALAVKGRKPNQLMIDANHLKAYRTAASLLKTGCSPTYRTQPPSIRQPG
jgi:putative transposase